MMPADGRTLPQPHRLSYQSIVDGSATTNRSVLTLARTTAQFRAAHIGRQSRVNASRAFGSSLADAGLIVLAKAQDPPTAVSNYTTAVAQKQP